MLRLCVYMLLTASYDSRVIVHMYPPPPPPPQGVAMPDFLNPTVDA
jgi:hypothetical protein